MKVVRIGFSKPKNKLFPLFSWAIRLLEGTKYSHVYLTWESMAGPSIVYEASGTRVRFMNKKYFDEIAETLDVYSFEITKEDYRHLIKFVMENVGTEYGMKQVLGIALVKIFNLKKNPFSDGKASQVCSETVAYFMQDVLGHEILFDKDIAGPKMIHDFLENMKQEKNDGRD